MPRPEKPTTKVGDTITVWICNGPKDSTSGEAVAAIKREVLLAPHWSIKHQLWAIKVGDGNRIHLVYFNPDPDLERGGRWELIL